MAYLVKAPRVGRSQGAVIFWGLVSAFFASAFCYYYLRNRTNEENARTLNDQVIILQGERDSLSSERDKMEAAAGETDKELRARADFLQDKETKLAEEESDIESMSSSASQNQAQASGVKHFDDASHRLAAKTPGAEVVQRGGRPVLRVPATVFFGYGDAQLLPDGKAVLDQAAQALGGSARFEMRVETFSDGEDAASAPAATENKSAPAPAAPKPSHATAWDLTAARAASIAKYLHDQGTLPFQNVLVLGRGDFAPVASSSKDPARNRRVEITLTPVATFYHSPDAAHGGKSGGSASGAAGPATP